MLHSGHTGMSASHARVDKDGVRFGDPLEHWARDTQRVGQVASRPPGRCPRSSSPIEDKAIASPWGRLLPRTVQHSCTCRAIHAPTCGPGRPSCYFFTRWCARGRYASGLLVVVLKLFRWLVARGACSFLSAFLFFRYIYIAEGGENFPSPDLRSDASYKLFGDRRAVVLVGRCRPSGAPRGRCRPPRFTAISIHSMATRPRPLPHPGPQPFRSRQSLSGLQTALLSHL